MKTPGTMSETSRLECTESGILEDQDRHNEGDLNP